MMLAGCSLTFTGVTDMTQSEQVQEALAAGVNPKSNVEIANFINTHHKGAGMTAIKVAQAKAQAKKKGDTSSPMKPNPLFDGKPAQPSAIIPTGGSVEGAYWEGVEASVTIGRLIDRVGIETVRAILKKFEE
jgi:hypothetical protein